jgi:hypothetical protein
LPSKLPESSFKYLRCLCFAEKELQHPQEQPGQPAMELGFDQGTRNPMLLLYFILLPFSLLKGKWFDAGGSLTGKLACSNFRCLKNSHSGDVTDSIGRPTIFKTTSTDRPHFRHVEYLIANKILMGFAEIRNLVQF